MAGWSEIALHFIEKLSKRYGRLKQRVFNNDLVRREYRVRIAEREEKLRQSKVKTASEVVDLAAKLRANGEDATADAILGGLRFVLVRPTRAAVPDAAHKLPASSMRTIDSPQLLSANRQE